MVLRTGEFRASFFNFKKNQGDINVRASEFTPNFALELAGFEKDLEPFGWELFHIEACAPMRMKISTE